MTRHVLVNNDQRLHTTAGLQPGLLLSCMYVSFFRIFSSLYKLKE